MQKFVLRIFISIIFATSLALLIALPAINWVEIGLFGHSTAVPFGIPKFTTQLKGLKLSTDIPIKRGLDISGGMQVVLEADVSGLSESDRQAALNSAKAVITRRVDLYGIAEPVVQTARMGDSYRIIVELPGVDDPTEALSLVGQTANLQFLLISQDFSDDMQATVSGTPVTNLIETGLGGQQLKQASLNFDPQSNQPIVSLEFNPEGTSIFADVTSNHIGETLGIFLDGSPLMLPTIQSAILDGQAAITGQFSVDEAKQLSIQLNAGALPVPIRVLEQRNIGASLGQESVTQSVMAGIIGLSMVMLFMILLYGWQGVIANMALVVFAILTIAIYKVLGITLTLPGIAGLILTIGMAVDANILIAERIREEHRRGRSMQVAMELGFGRAWDSIKDANMITILTALVLINPFDFSFLNSSGLVKGFGLTLLIGVLLGLFTGVVVTRNFTRMFLRGDSHD